MIILADASLPLLQDLFSRSFQLKTYHCPKEIPTLLSQNEVLLCRSTLSVNQHFLKQHAFKIIATASSGTDHIDKAYLHQNNIKLLDAKGANAAAVADYVLATLAYLNISSSKTVGIIGMGAVGRCVVERLRRLGFEILCYDPWLPEYAQVCIEDILECDVISLHAELQDRQPFPSRNLLNLKHLQRLKPGTVLINAARGGLVDERALLQLKPDIFYCTDVYCNEPNISPELIDYATICTPHIAGHSIEAKQAAVVQIAEQLHDYYQRPLLEIQNNWRQNHHINSNHWQEALLEYYNPIAETVQLKQARDKASTFQSLRKAHNQRHDIDWWP